MWTDDGVQSIPQGVLPGPPWVTPCSVYRHPLHFDVCRLTGEWELVHWPASQSTISPFLRSCCSSSLQVDGVGLGGPLTRTRIQVAHKTVPQKCAHNTLPARPGILYHLALAVQRCLPLPTSATRAPEATPN